MSRLINVNRRMQIYHLYYKTGGTLLGMLLIRNNESKFKQCNLMKELIIPLLLGPQSYISSTNSSDRDKSQCLHFASL